MHLRRLFVALSVVLATALACFFAGVPASAHSELEASSPADGGRVSDVTSVSLTFGEEVVPEYTKLSLSNDSGMMVALDPATTDATGTVVSAIAAEGALVEGAYILDFYIVSIDGHPVEGNVSFVVVPSSQGDQTATPTADAQSGASETPVPLAIEARDASTPAEDSSWVWIGTALAALVVLIAVSAVLLVAVRRARNDSTGTR